LIYIIGSGLSGIAAAKALVERGFRPTILDAGLRADSDTRGLKSRLASLEPDEWNPDDVAQLKHTGSTSATGIPQKLHFGSNFPYRDLDQETAATFHHASILRSFAQGGFSNVWGAVIQRLGQRDLRRWPISFEQLSRHYEAVQRFISPSAAPMKPSAQSRAMHADLEPHRARLERDGVHFSYATLAVRTIDDESGKGCRQCGMCIYGCPYDSVFSAASQLTQMVLRGQVDYQPDVLVDRISTNGIGIRIEGRSASDNSPRYFEGRKAFLAAGVLESARIVLNSTNHHTVRLRVQQSDIFTVPLLRYRSTPGIELERLHTLCQTVVEIRDAAICEEPIQLQLYGYNDLYSQILASRTGAFSKPLAPALRALSQRLIVAFGYFHSDVSSAVWLSRTDSATGRLQLEGQPTRERKRMGDAVVQKLFQMRRHFQAVPVPLQLRFDEPGGSHRSGGSFPMRRTPAALETNEWGTLGDLPGLHIVDASVLPSVPAGPVAFTAMANAHRIASECAV